MEIYKVTTWLRLEKCTKKKNENDKLHRMFLVNLSVMSILVPVVSVTTSRSIPSGWSSNFSSSDNVGFTPSMIYKRKMICQEISVSQLKHRETFIQSKGSTMFSTSPIMSS